MPANHAASFRHHQARDPGLHQSLWKRAHIDAQVLAVERNGQRGFDEAELGNAVEVVAVEGDGVERLSIDQLGHLAGQRDLTAGDFVLRGE